MGPVRQVMLDSQKIDGRFARRIRIVRAQRTVFPDRHQLQRRIAITNPRADKDHPRALTRELHRLEQVEASPKIESPRRPRIGEARLRVGLRRQMIDHLGLLLAHDLGELRLALLDEVESLDPRGSVPRCASSAGHRPDADNPTTRSPRATRCSVR